MSRIVFIRVILGVYRDNGKENGNYYSRLGLYGDNGKENGNYYSRLGLYGVFGDTLVQNTE